MALKGKSRRRSSSRHVSRAPVKPAERAVPLPERPGFRRVLVVVLSVLTALGGARVWVNATRSQSLQTYLKSLAAAQSPLLRHLDPSNQNTVGELVRKFTRAEITSATLKTASETWERDFRVAMDRIASIDPPVELDAAHDTLLEAVDMYVGVARMLNLVAQDREVADRFSGKPQADFENQVQVTIQHATEWQARAEDVYAIATRRIDALRKAWLGLDESPSIPGVPRGLLTAVPSAPPPPTAP